MRSLGAIALGLLAATTVVAQPTDPPQDPRDAARRVTERNGYPTRVTTTDQRGGVRSFPSLPGGGADGEEGDRQPLQRSGHTDLGDRCCVFDSDSKLISASWDKTLRVWDLESGEEMYSLQDHNKARGVAVWKSRVTKRWKAVSTGSGCTLSIWDLHGEEGKLLKRLETGHTSSVWGLTLIEGRKVPVAHSQPKLVPMALTYSNDGTVRVWDLTHDNEHEIVAGRRALKPTPMCVAALPPSYGMGTFPVLVGGFASIKLLDMSNIGTGPSGGALWACYAANFYPFKDWSSWLLDAIKEESPHFMYSRERSSELPTLIHKLAADPHGHTLLTSILSAYRAGRQAIVSNQRLEDKGAQMKGMATIGLISRVGPSPQGNALTVAVNKKHEEMATLLLDDYKSHIQCFDYTMDGLAVTNIEEVTEADLVTLFETFPVLAESFIITLPLRRTKLVADSSRCDFSAALNDTLIRPADETVEALTNGKGVQWWDEYLDKQWETSDAKNKKPGMTRAEDSAWGIKVRSDVIPIKAGGSTTVDAPPDASQAASTAKQGGYEPLVDEVSRNSAEGSDEPQAEASYDQPAFSKLLNVCLDYADEKGSPAIFKSPVLQAIVQYKWEQRCKTMYHSMFVAYLIHIVNLTWVTLSFDTWQFDVGISQEDLGAEMDHLYQWKRVAIWTGWGLAILYNMLLLKHEYTQMREDGIKSYLSDFFNVIDIAGALLSAVSLLMMTYLGGAETDPNQLMLDVIQALAMLFCWFKVLYFLRGLDQTAFLVKCLVQIGIDIRYFLVVLAVILTAFCIAFFLLLRLGIDGEGHSESFKELPMSFVSVYDMMFGSFDPAWFSDAPNMAFVSIIVFMVFMLIVPTVMLNALIAIMSDTYMVVQESSKETNVQQRAEIIRELEGPMRHRKGVGALSMSSLIVRTLCTMEVTLTPPPHPTASPAC